MSRSVAAQAEATRKKRCVTMSKGMGNAFMKTSRFLIGSTLATLASACAPASTQQAAANLPARAPEAPLFEFHSAFWINLHHYLHALGRQNSPRADMLPAGATVGELQAWAGAIAHYREHYGARRLVLDTELVRLKLQLAAAESADSLFGATIGVGLRRLLESVAPIYRKYWWPEHDVRNREFSAASDTLIRQYGPAIAPRLAASFGATWPANPVRVDLVYDAGPPGNAYTTNDPTHVVMGTGDGHQGLVTLELLFHEASHGWDAVFMNDIQAATTRLKVRVPGQLWHALLFFNAGIIAADVLRTAGVSDYVMYADRGLFEKVFTGWRPPIAKHWPLYLAGTISREDAISRIVQDLVSRARARDSAVKSVPSPVRVTFNAHSDTFAAAAREYTAVWNREGARIWPERCGAPPTAPPLPIAHDRPGGFVGDRRPEAVVAPPPCASPPQASLAVPRSPS
jgi:hypothetical protein